MTYREAPKMRPVTPDNGRLQRTEDASYTAWFLGGIVALALIFGGIFMFGGNDGTMTTASNMNRPFVTQPSTNPPSTTGQRSEPVQPTNPAGNTPTATGPAR
jgi:hypothetical protein